MVPGDSRVAPASLMPIAVGEEAHIVAEEDNGPRGDPSMPISERNAYPNLILLCPTHHRVADKDHGAHFSVARLHDMKTAHEALVERRRMGADDGQATWARRRRELLLEAASVSRGRLIARWVAAGVNTALAQVLADDDSVGSPARLGRVLPQTGLTVLEGDFGSGKSVSAERIHQVDIAVALDDEHAPAPVYLVAKSVRGSLMDAVRSAAEGLGRPVHLGLRLVVDGLDEPGPARAIELLNEARSLAFTWPDTRIVVTARPTLDLQQEERLAQALLSDAEAAALALRLRGYAAINWPQHGSTGSMLRLPLFFIVAIANRQFGAGISESRGTLLEVLANAALNRTQAPTDKAREALLLLARLATQWGGTVTAAELGSDDAARWVLETRLVVRAGRSLRFALPVVEQYFAARSVLEVGLDELDLDDLRQLDRWRDSLTLAVTIGSWDQVSSLLDVITPRYPGLTSWLLRNALPKWPTYSSTDVPGAVECARRLCHALTIWVMGLGSLGQLLGLTDQTGQVRTVGAVVDGRDVTVGLRIGECRDQKAVQLPSGFDPMASVAPDGSEWDPVCSGRPAAEFAAWPWQWAQDWVSESLERLLRARSLALPDSQPFRDERRWQLAKAVIGGRSRADWPLSLREARVAAEQLLVRMEGQGMPHYRRARRGLVFSQDEIAAFVRDLAPGGRLREDFMLFRPYPSPDTPPYTMRASCYSDESLQLLVEQIYTNALAIYRSLVAAWFPGFVPMLGIACMLPIAIHGQLRRRQDRSPDFSYYFEPLPPSANSRVEARLTEPSMQQIGPIVSSFMERLVHARAVITTQRPEAEAWARPRSENENLPIWGDAPATEIAYRWLAEDLRSLSMVSQSSIYDR